MKVCRSDRKKEGGEKIINILVCRKKNNCDFVSRQFLLRYSYLLILTSARFLSSASVERHAESKAVNSAILLALMHSSMRVNAHFGEFANLVSHVGRIKF